MLSRFALLQAQSGFTGLGENLMDNDESVKVASFQIVRQGLDDFVNVTTRTCTGWYWGCMPALVVGITVRWFAAGLIHVSGRSQQAKKPIQETLTTDVYSFASLLAYLAVFGGLIAIAVLLITYQQVIDYSQ